MAGSEMTNYDTLLGRMAIDQKLCSEEEVQHCKKEMKARTEANNPATLERLLLEKRFITKTQVARLRNSIRESKDAAGQIPGYKVLGKLGSGAMAVVYKAQQLSLDRTVAIKVLPKKFVQKSDYVERFYKEGRIANVLVTLDRIDCCLIRNRRHDEVRLLAPDQFFENMGGPDPESPCIFRS